MTINVASALDLTSHPAFGAYPPTPAQQSILRWFHSTPLGFTRFRRKAVDRFRAARAGPVDARLFDLAVRFHPQDNQTDAKGAVCGSCYNFHEMRWLAPHLTPGSVFVDVGANMGFFSLFAAKRGARVVAIEPLPTLFERMSVNMALNGFVAHRFNEAVGVEAGVVTIFPAGDLGGSSILGEGAGIDVPIRPLLDLLGEAGVEKIDALKIDVEGWEDRVLCSFFATAPRALWPTAIVIEHSSAAQWAKDLIGDLRARGYVRRARNRGNSLFRLPSAAPR